MCRYDQKVHLWDPNTYQLFKKHKVLNLINKSNDTFHDPPVYESKNENDLYSFRSFLRFLTLGEWNCFGNFTGKCSETNKENTLHLQCLTQN